MAKVTTDHRAYETLYTIEGDDLDDVEEAIARVERAYPPLGYGTAFHKVEQRADGSWITRGYRSNSCD